MSEFEFLDFSLCDPTPLDMTLATDEDMSIGQFLEPLPSAFDLPLLSGMESAGGASSSSFSLGLDALEGQHSTTQAPSEPTIWGNEFLEFSGFFPPRESDIIHETPKPFDGEIPVEDTSSEDLKRYIQRTGKTPYFNVFIEQPDIDAIAVPDSHAKTSSTPVRPRVVSVPKRRKQVLSRSSSVTASDTSDHPASHIRNRKSTQQAAGSYRTARTKAPKPAAVLKTPRDEPPAKTVKKRKTFNSACAADDLAQFAPVPATTVASPLVAPSVNSSPLTSVSDSSDTETPSYPLKAVAKKRKRKFKAIDRDEDFNPSDDDDDSLEFIAAKEERKKQPVSSQWTLVDLSYSQRRTNKGMEYRCERCFAENNTHICSREGDMARHLQSLKHTTKSFFCSNANCSSGFTRGDALKRHMKTCKAT